VYPALVKISLNVLLDERIPLVSGSVNFWTQLATGFILSCKISSTVSFKNEYVLSVSYSFWEITTVSKFVSQSLFDNLWLTPLIINFKLSG
jgi:hypothetical protein